MQLIRRFDARLFGVTGVAALVLVGCTGSISTGGRENEPVVDDDDDIPPSPVDIKGLPLCETSGPQTTFAPMRRLTRAEYNNTVRDLIGDTTGIASGFTSDETAGGFAANSVAPIDEKQMQGYVDAAEKLAKTAVATRLPTLLKGCSASDRSCIDKFVDDFGGRAFRRPLSSDLKKTLMDLYDLAAGKWTPVEAVEMVVQAILASPYFLYHVEPQLAVDEIMALDGPALASRLSYFLWQSMPDDDLFAAAKGDLNSDEVLESQVLRMLDNERARDTLRSFHSQWMGLDADGEALEDMFKDPDKFPMWKPELAGAMREETVTFADDVIRNGDSKLETLLTAPYTFVNQTLAPIYGLEMSGSAMQRVDLEASRRAGLLTHPSFLTSQAHAADSSWVKRGKFIREQVLCEELTPPPPDVDMTVSNDPNRLSNPSCKGCHTLIDPIGLGLENFDAVGKWRDNDDSDNPIDGVGNIADLDGTDVAGSFEGPRGLAEKLAGSGQVKACMAKTWYRYAVRREATESDGCSIRGAFDRFDQAGGNIKELILAVALSDGFRNQKGAGQ